MRGAEIINNDAHKCSTASKNLLPVVLINEETSLSECQVETEAYHLGDRLLFEITASKLLMSTLRAMNH